MCGKAREDSAFISNLEDTGVNTYYSLLLHGFLLYWMGILNRVKSDHFPFKFANF